MAKSQPANPMSLERAFAIIRNQGGTSDELSTIVGINDDLDLLLSEHPNSGAETLAQLARSKCDEVRRRVVRHPNMPQNELLHGLANEFPADFLKHPAFDWLIVENPKFFEGLVPLLEVPGCPDSLIGWAAKFGTESQKEKIYLQELGAPELRSHLTSEYFEARQMNKIQRAIDGWDGSDDDDGVHPILRDAVPKYAATGRPYALPGYFPQDKSNVELRTHDMIGGYPYTSAAYPWPRTEDNGLYMQPVVQINLALASELLGEEWGAGLVQVWGRVDKTEEESNRVRTENWISRKGSDQCLLVRHISTKDIATIPSDFYPEFAPWLPGITSECVLFVGSSLAQRQQMATSPLVKWKTMESMFQFRDWGVGHDFLSDYVSRSDYAETGVDWYEATQQLRYAVEDLLTHPGRLHLGGYGGHGGQSDPTGPTHVLFYAFENLGLGQISWGIDRSRERSQGHSFRAVFSHSDR